ncbi:hypothetical protein [Natrarchaeobaculum sulfurireducens]|uniref:Uncharacterized protein n=1 Tax=Natrarchaeobaculum sulfurireducens TaxID=2044521 RepID=A0A346PSU4_9EURY|nr:hypothetical protein [Natrarchaeobaculum sulfurireducens]AXR82589.1 hypothetical protein AArcMg_2599 [Natrarchaeobaculum sulfurireducens]
MLRSNRLLVTVTVACILLAGCTGVGTMFDDDSEADTTVDAEELLANADAVETYHVEVTRTLQAPAVNETTRLDGVVDRENRLASLYSTSETDLGDGPETTETEQYVDGDVQYTTDSGDWDREVHHDEADVWAELDRLERAVETVDDTAFEDADRIRTETIAGTETTMFELDVPDDRKDELAGVDEQAHVATSVEQLVYYVYVDTETNTLYGTDLRMEVTQGEGSALITTETMFSEFDDADEVSVPDAAIEETE